MNSSKQTLTKKLADLLGFGDGADDVLEHLLSIESSDDLLDYLSQLLGQDGDNLKLFVGDVERYRRGESLTIEELPRRQDNQQPKQERQAANKVEAIADAQQKNTPPTRNKQQQKGTKKPVSTQEKASNFRSSAAKTPSMDNQISQNKKPAPVTKATKEQKKNKSAVTPLTPKKSCPPKGKASTVCGCFGTVHKTLTNCLYCGRISCAKEGYDFCAFCEHLVEQFDATPTEAISSDDPKATAAWLHKERLLRFDRESAQRTVVLDVQSDYYSNSKSTWLTQEERQDAEELEEQREKDLHHRKNQTLNITF